MSKRAKRNKRRYENEWADEHERHQKDEVEAMRKQWEEQQTRSMKAAL